MEHVINVCGEDVHVGSRAVAVDRMASVVVPDPQEIAVRGRAAWRSLHSCDLTLEVLERLVVSLRAFGCACDVFYDKWVKSHPFPADADDRTRFNWSVDLHNAVNAKLAGEGHKNKRQWSYDEAWLEWRVGRECDRCGLCCREMRVDGISDADRAREPRLPVVFPAKGCPLIGDDNLCSCYETRPDVCRRFVAGSLGCAVLRAANGLPELK